MYQRMAKSILFFLVMCLSSAHALSSDQEKVMHVQADSADLSQHNHKGIYTGNVELIQGTSHLQAAKAVTIGNEKNQLVSAFVSGGKWKQAHYWTITHPKKPPLHAYADTIRYYPKRHF